MKREHLHSFWGYYLKDLPGLPLFNHQDTGSYDLTRLLNEHWGILGGQFDKLPL